MFVPRFARWPEFGFRLAAFTELLRERIQFLMTIARSRAALGAEVLFLRKQARLLPRARDSTAATDGCCAAVACTLVALLRLEGVARHSDHGDVHPLASQGLQVLLALEIAWRPTCAAEGNPPAHRSHGKGKRDLGRRAHRR